MIKILIADDQRLMAEGLKSIIEFEDDMQVVAIAKDGEEVIKLCEVHKIDIILMDVRMPKINGVEATKIIKEKYKEIKILILTTFDQDNYIIDGLANGASGYMLKDIEGESLVNAIRNVESNKYILPSNIAQKLAESLKHKKSNNQSEALRELTSREIEVAKMISEGFTNKQIASALYLSFGTVKNIVSNIYSKIQISDRAKAALYLKDLF